ncbi:MAG TPA: DUF2218 domain-containing protein [Sphingomicrobium sp.]|nr:DUF2218 domain-containing protein [Sphingomicrobium sp.]
MDSTKENPTVSAETICGNSVSVPTRSASRYLQQLSKHWSRNITVEFTPTHGTVIFRRDTRGAEWPGDALVTSDARDDALEIRIDASSAEQLNGLKGAVARHLDRFAFRGGAAQFRLALGQKAEPGLHSAGT